MCTPVRATGQLTSEERQIMTGRRQFLQGATSKLAAISVLGLASESHAAPVSDEWDFAWATRLTGKRKAVFDVAEIEGGAGVFRAATWAAQCTGILGVAPTDLSPVIVLRAHAVALALSQSFWDRQSVGRALGVTLPLSDKATTRNPVLMEAGDGLPPQLANGTLPRQLARGVTVLACNLALQAWVDAVSARDKVSAADARTIVLAALVPGVILQPSGILAAILAQEQGCAYLRAS